MDNEKEILRQKLLDEKRHQEIVDGIKKIPESIELFAKKVESVNSPKELVEQLGIFVSEIRGIGKMISDSNGKVISAIEQRKLPESFELVRNGNGTISNINVNYKKI